MVFTDSRYVVVYENKDKKSRRIKKAIERVSQCVQNSIQVRISGIGAKPMELGRMITSATVLNSSEFLPMAA